MSVKTKEKQGKPGSANGRKIPDYIWDEAKKELRLVKGKFRIFESGKEGGSEPIMCQKYPLEICPPFKMVMTDGYEYEIPLYVARFINGFDSNAKKINGNIHSCSYAQHGFKMSNPNDLKRGEEAYCSDGATIVPSVAVTGYKKRYGFDSLEFSSEIS